MARLRDLFKRAPSGLAVPQGGQSTSLATLVNALTTNPQLRSQLPSGFRPLPADPSADVPFGPLQPFPVQPLDQPGRNGRTVPRAYEYQVAENLNLDVHARVPFQMLKDASKNIDMIRNCIETRKKELSARAWGFTIDPKAINREAMLSGQSERDVRQEMLRKYAADIRRANEFWDFPGKNQDFHWAEWIYAALEYYLVYDALPVYPHKTYGKDLHALDLIDPSTIKPLLDGRGVKPQVPHPAYQQLLYGFPRGEYTTTYEYDENGNKVVPGPYAQDQLYYIRRWTVPETPYGFSAVEQALISARLYLKRQGWMLAEYDDGVVPRAWIKWALSSGEIELDPEQRRVWERALNDDLAGNTAERHRLRVLVPGMEPVESSNTDERYKPDYDLFLIKLLACPFGVPISELGFSEAKGLGSSGWHEGQEDSAERKGNLPDARWMSDQISRISHEQLGLNQDVIHTFSGLDQEDEAAQDAVWETRVRSGRATLNDDRARNNLPLYTFDEADMPMLMTTRGVVFLEGASKTAPSGTMIEPAEFNPSPSLQNGPQTAQNGPSGAKTAPKASPPTKTAPKTAQKPVSAAQKAAEASAWRNWAKKPHPRPFEFKFCGPDDLPHLADDPRVVWSHDEPQS